MIRNIILYVLALQVLFTLNNCLFAQEKTQTTKKEVNSKMYIVDTITIESPVLIKVTDTMGKFQYLIAEKENLILIDTLINQGAKQSILKSESFFCPTYKFSCLLNNYISSLDNKKMSAFIEIKESIQKSETEVWREFKGNNLLTNNNYSLYTINIKTFLVVLVRNDFLELCQSRDEIKTSNNNNLYRKILVPITW